MFKLRKTLIALCTVAAVVAIASPAEAANHESRTTHVEWNPQDVNLGGGATANYSTTQWNLDRVDQHPLLLNGVYAPVYGFGNGVDVYVVDTGVRITHTQFQGRASYGYDFVDNDAVADDCYGHGTHVAGTVAGVNTGSARYANVIAVRVLDCNGNGTQAEVVNGLNWVRSHAATTGRRSIVNMSLGFASGNTPVDNAAAALINAGIPVVAAAGNDGVNACSQSPARVPAVETVGNLTKTDTKNATSNIGSCIDLFAPGTSVISTCKQSDTATCSMTGTSMSSPEVAGAFALYLRQFPSASVATTLNWVNNRATVGAIIGSTGGAPNKILYVGV